MKMTEQKQEVVTSDEFLLRSIVGVTALAIGSLIGTGATLIKLDMDEAAARRDRAPAVQKANEGFDTLPVTSRISFVDAHKANVLCDDKVTGKKAIEVVLPPGGPERDNIMQLLNNGTCRTSLKP
jgi:hypothetical protein